MPNYNAPSQLIRNH